MSLSSMLSIARSALLAQQRAMNVTTRNIANASTPGYSRQRMILGSVGSVPGLLSGGIDSLDRVRIRDPFLDDSFRRESGSLNSAMTSSYFLAQVESAIDEPSETGVSAAMSEMFQAFGRLSDEPSSPAARESARAAAERLVTRLNHLASSLGKSVDRALEQMNQEVDDVNNMIESLASLNTAIQETTGGEIPPELLDERDRVLDDLANRLSIRVTPSEDGTVTVTSSGLTLVNGGATQKIRVSTLENGGFGITSTAGQLQLNPESGSLLALTQLTSQKLPGFQTQLDDLARSLVEEMNSLHASGFNANGETGINFFDPDGVTAGSISISDEVAASVDAIATGTTSSAGDNEIALAMASLANQSISGLGDRTFSDHYAAFAASVGTEVRAASEDEIAFGALVNNVESWRQSISGVSVDEEMINLIDQQEAYSAAARLVGVADGLIQEILALVR